jgi:hypothetical protein
MLRPPMWREGKLVRGALALPLVRGLGHHTSRRKGLSYGLATGSQDFDQVESLFIHGIRRITQQFVC